jgi:hypothetical protein
MTDRPAPVGFDKSYWASFLAEVDAIAEEARLGDPKVLLAAATDIAMEACEPDLFAVVQLARAPLNLDDDAEPVMRRRDARLDADVGTFAARYAAFQRERRAEQAWVPVLIDNATERALRRRGRFTVFPAHKLVLTAGGAVEGGWQQVQAKLTGAT